MNDDKKLWSMDEITRYALRWKKGMLLIALADFKIYEHRNVAPAHQEWTKGDIGLVMSPSVTLGSVYDTYRIGQTHLTFDLFNIRTEDPCHLVWPTGNKNIHQYLDIYTPDE